MRPTIRASSSTLPVLASMFEDRSLVALSCGELPEGHAQWSLRLLADRAVELDYIDSVSHETVRRVLDVYRAPATPPARWCAWTRRRGS